MSGADFIDRHREARFQKIQAVPRITRAHNSSSSLRVCAIQRVRDLALAKPNKYITIGPIFSPSPRIRVSSGHHLNFTKIQKQQWVSLSVRKARWRAHWISSRRWLPSSPTPAISKVIRWFFFEFDEHSPKNSLSYWQLGKRRLLMENLWLCTVNENGEGDIACESELRRRFFFPTQSLEVIQHLRCFFFSSLSLCTYFHETCFSSDSFWIARRTYITLHSLDECFLCIWLSNLFRSSLKMTGKNVVFSFWFYSTKAFCFDPGRSITLIVQWAITINCKNRWDIRTRYWSVLSHYVMLFPVSSSLIVFIRIPIAMTSMPN